MTMQIFGGAFVCIATTVMGMHMAKAGARRMTDLTEVKKTLILLKSQLDFAIYTLPQAFGHISERASPPFSSFYAGLASELQDSAGQDAGVAWANAIERLTSTNLNKDDLANLSTLSMAIGQMDVQVQINSIEMIIASIDEALTKLNADNPKNAKMYRGLGVISGLLITIVLL